MIRQSDIKWWAGLITCVCGALLGQAEMIGEPWRHYVSVLFIIGTAVTGYLIKGNHNEP